MAIHNETEMPPSEEETEKVSKSTAEYRPAEGRDECLACANFKEPDRCSEVRGEISPTGTCNLWESPNEIDGFEFGDAQSMESILFGPGDQ